MNDAKIRVIGHELHVLALRFHTITEDSHRILDELKLELDTADPSSPESKELEKLVLGLGRCLPSTFRSTEVYNHAGAMQQFPLCKLQLEEKKGILAHA